MYLNNNKIKKEKEISKNVAFESHGVMPTTNFYTTYPFRYKKGEKYAYWNILGFHMAFPKLIVILLLMLNSNLKNIPVQKNTCYSYYEEYGWKEATRIDLQISQSMKKLM